MTDLGLVAIGRNEGERLRLCLQSVVGRGFPVVYVDSKSTDGSPALARSLGAEVVELDMSLPFSAARARNEGFERLIRIAPDVKYVQFVDGDCEVVVNWIEKARATLDREPKAAVACGRRRERFPEQSVYNKLADHEWDTPVGVAQSCGGDALVRVEAFRAVGGYDPSVAAGEEPELCQRLREAGWTIHRIDAEMTIHDSAIFSLAQWWRRFVRNGYGQMDVVTRFRRGPDGLFVGHMRKAKTWAIYWPVAIVLAAAAGATVGGVASGTGAAVALAVLGAAAILMLLPLNALRLAVKERPRLGGDWKTALAYGWLMMLGKFATYVGMTRYRADRAAGRNTRLIEYKQPSRMPTATATSS